MVRVQQRHDQQSGHGAAEHLLKKEPGQVQGGCAGGRGQVQGGWARGGGACRGGTSEGGAHGTVYACSFVCVAPPTPPTHMFALLCTAQHIDGINLFGLISIVSLLFCVPLAVVCESKTWASCWALGVSRVGEAGLYKMLALSGLFYHLYNQVPGGAGWQAGTGGSWMAGRLAGWMAAGNPVISPPQPFSKLGGQAGRCYSLSATFLTSN